MKTIRTWLPVSLYDIPGLEGWLEDQAKRGLFPTGLGSWASFRTGAIPGTRFRLEPWGKLGTEPDPEQLELYEAQGWKYAFSIGRAYFLFYTEDPQAPDLYIDCQSRALSLERLEHRVRHFVWGTRILYGGLILVLAALGLRIGRFDVQPDFFVRLPLLLLYAASPVFLIFLACGLFSWHTNRRDWRTLRRTYLALKEGLPPPPSPGPSRAIVRENQITLALLVPLAVLLVWSYRDHAKPLEDFSLPYLSLSQMEAVPLTTYEDLYGSSSFHEDENQGERLYSLLAPVWYEVTQDGIAAQEGDYEGYSPDPEGGKYRYAPSLDQTHFRVLFPALARPVAEAQLDLYRLVNLRWTYEEIEVPGLDFVILAKPKGEDKVWQMLALGRSRDVAVFRYGGPEDLREHLDVLSRLLDT